MVTSSQILDEIMRKGASVGVSSSMAVKVSHTKFADFPFVCLGGGEMINLRSVCGFRKSHFPRTNLSEEKSS